MDLVVPGPTSDNIREDYCRAIHEFFLLMVAVTFIPNNDREPEIRERSWPKWKEGKQQIQNPTVRNVKDENEKNKKKCIATHKIRVVRDQFSGLRLCVCVFGCVRERCEP